MPTIRRHAYGLAVAACWVALGLANAAAATHLTPPIPPGLNAFAMSGCVVFALAVVTGRAIQQAVTAIQGLAAEQRRMNDESVRPVREALIHGYRLGIEHGTANGLREDGARVFHIPPQVYTAGRVEHEEMHGDLHTTTIDLVRQRSSLPRPSRFRRP